MPALELLRAAGGGKLQRKGGGAICPLPLIGPSQYQRQKGMLPKPEISDFRFQISNYRPEANDIRYDIGPKNESWHFGYRTPRGGQVVPSLSMPPEAHPRRGDIPRSIIIMARSLYPLTAIEEAAEIRKRGPAYAGAALRRRARLPHSRLVFSPGSRCAGILNFTLTTP